MRGNDAFVTPPSNSVTISGQGTLSSMTFSESSHPSPPAAVAMKKPRATMTAAGLRQAEAISKKKEHNAAFKRATIMYDCERKKVDGLSAQAVVELIQLDTHVQLCAQTIQKKVKEGEIGVSPLRRGPKGNIPDRH